MLKLTGLNKYIRKTEKQKARIKQGATNYVRGVVRSVLRDLVLHTPQWSGDTAASWRIHLNNVPAAWGPSRLAQDDWEDLIGKAKFIGDREAWRVALEDNAPAFAAIRWNSKIAIHNTAPFADELATMTSREALEQLRPGNYIQGDVMAIKLVSMKYKLASNVVGLGLKKDFS